ncbi:hypothetical protein ACLB2K_073272 [Fragaria x ananassa]
MAKHKISPNKNLLETQFTLLLCCMAITTGICPSPSQPPPLPTLSLPTLTPLKTNLPFPSKFGANLVSNDALVNGAAAEAVALARAVAEVTRDAAAVRVGSSEVWSCNESGGGMMVRRKKRRMRRRKGLECFDDEERKRELEDGRFSFGVVRYGYLSPREEADCCMSLKEGAKLESERTRVTETQEHEPTSKQLANAMRIKMSSIDKVICNRRESQERIIKSYRGLVVSVASSYQGKGLSLQDLIQEGSIGLLRGAEKFDPERGLKVSTYVYWWIRQAIIRAIENKSRIIRLPGHMGVVMAKITRAKISFNQRFQRLPSHGEIAEMINVQASIVRLVCERSKLPLSLDRVVTDQGCMALQDIIRGPDEMMPETMLKKQLMKQEVEKLLNTLSDREAEVLRLHFGLNGDTPQSFEEIGRVLKLSRERVRQINSIALSKLKQTSTLDDLKLYIV